MNAPNKTLALEMWGAGFLGPVIAAECGYADARGVFQLVRRRRQRGDPLPVRRRGLNRRGVRCWRYARTIELKLTLRLTETQIAERVGLSVFGVRNHIARAKRRGEFNTSFVKNWTKQALSPEGQR